MSNIINIKNLDCFKYLETLKNNSIDLFLLDLPYGITDQNWDEIIDLDKMWVLIKQKIKMHGQILFFCNASFGYQLIKSNPRWFVYDMIWVKPNVVGYLSAKKMLLKKHELVYLFKPNHQNDTERQFNKENRKYAELYDNYLKSINVTKKSIKDVLGCWGMSHFFGYRSTQFSLPTEENYNKISKLHGVDKQDFYKTYKQLKEQESEKGNFVYNPQMVKGTLKPYRESKVNYASNYGEKVKINYGGDMRYPTTLLNFKYDAIKEKYHPTQKPVLMLEWLIKTYSNEGMNVCDFTMGSGSTCIACINTKRNFYGCELDEKIFKTAKKRIEKHKEKNNI